MDRTEDLSTILQEIEEKLHKKQDNINKSFETIFELLKELTTKAECYVDQSNNKVYEEVETLVKQIKILQTKKSNMHETLKTIKTNIAELFKGSSQEYNVK